VKITVLTIGTRGEVQPCIALGLGLQAAGQLSIQAATDQEMRNRAAASGERIRAEDSNRQSGRDD
jgi:UDP:flavonoid glycosyltransferase YjiC (YdhE family)